MRNKYNKNQCSLIIIMCCSLYADTESVVITRLPVRDSDVVHFCTR